LLINLGCNRHTHLGKILGLNLKLIQEAYERNFRGLAVEEQSVFAVTSRESDGRPISLVVSLIVTRGIVSLLGNVKVAVHVALSLSTLRFQSAY